jgi:hypothetical protein
MGGGDMKTRKRKKEEKAKEKGEKTEEKGDFLKVKIVK